MANSELKERLRAQRLASQKQAGSAAEKKSTSMSHEEQLDFQVSVWTKADRKENHALRHVRQLGRSCNVEAIGKADDEALLDMISDEAWEDIRSKYNAYLMAGIEIVRPFARQLDGNSAKKSVLPSQREELKLKIADAVIAGDKALTKDLMAKLADLEEK